MPRRNRKVRDANRDRARKHAHRHDTVVPQVESRVDGPPTGQLTGGPQNVRTNPRRVYVSDQ